MTRMMYCTPSANRRYFFVATEHKSVVGPCSSLSGRRSRLGAVPLPVRHENPTALLFSRPPGINANDQRPATKGSPYVLCLNRSSARNRNTPTSALARPAPIRAASSIADSAPPGPAPLRSRQPRAPRRRPRSKQAGRRIPTSSFTPRDEAPYPTQSWRCIDANRQTGQCSWKMPITPPVRSPETGLLRAMAKKIVTSSGRSNIAKNGIAEATRPAGRAPPPGPAR